MEAEMTFEQQFQARVGQALDVLSVRVKQAERAAETGKEAGRLASALETVGPLFTLSTEEADGPVLARLIEVHSALATAAGTDRTEGDALAAQVRGMLGSGVDLPTDVTERAGKLLEAWQATAPKGKKGTGGTRSKGTGVCVEMHCGCGWVGRDATDVNSARWTWTGHLVAKHPTVTERPKKGSDDHTALTNVISAIAQGAETRAAAKLSDGTDVFATVDPS